MKRQIEDDGAVAHGSPREVESDMTTERVRVTDRRRINIEKAVGEASDTQQSNAGEATHAPSLKPTYVEELEARTRVAEQRVADVQERFEQLRADLQREMDATRARLNRAADERARQEKAAFVRSLLPVMDNLQLAITAASHGSSSMEILLDGLRGTINGFEGALTNAGVERIIAVGAPFDPELHEAVETVEVETERDNTVVAEYGSGYRFDNRLLRPARVKVGRARQQQTRKAEG